MWELPHIAPPHKYPTQELIHLGLFHMGVPTRRLPPHRGTCVQELINTGTNLPRASSTLRICSLLHVGAPGLPLTHLHSLFPLSSGPWKRQQTQHFPAGGS